MPMVLSVRSSLRSFCSGRFSSTASPTLTTAKKMSTCGAFSTFRLLPKTSQFCYCKGSPLRQYHRTMGSSSNDKTKASQTSKTKNEETGDGKVMSSLNGKSDSENGLTPVYVHPLSELVLLYLQTSECYGWVRRHCLDQSLVIHRDGSFVLSNRSRSDDKLNRTAGNQSLVTSTPSMKIRIWTSYDTMDKKHWLSLECNDKLHEERYLLQDNLLPAWHGRKSLPERIKDAVDKLMRQVDETVTLEARKRRR